jgi:hypothetical protein
MTLERARIYGNVFASFRADGSPPKQPTCSASTHDQA